MGYFGTDWFYLSNGDKTYIGKGVVKLIGGIFFVIFFVLGIFGIKYFISIFNISCSRRDETDLMANIIGSVLNSGPVVLWITDWIRILVNNFKDANGVALKSW